MNKKFNKVTVDRLFPKDEDLSDEDVESLLDVSLLDRTSNNYRYIAAGSIATFIALSEIYRRHKSSSNLDDD